MTPDPIPTPIGACNPTTTTVQTDCDDAHLIPPDSMTAPPPTLPPTGTSSPAPAGGGLLALAVGLAALRLSRRPA